MGSGKKMRESVKIHAMFLPFKAVTQLKLKLKGNEKTNFYFSATWLAGS